ncbi:MAG: DUF1553 domain-containing protein [Pyrinomonadaceae bacterium]|nr:DUF1553 domain-containing protein [Pyrinomonadaceae bacterium]
MSPTRYHLKIFIAALFVFTSLPFFIPASAFLVFSEAADERALPLAATDETAEKSEFFEKHVRPVLAANCYACHTESQSGGLRLDSLQSILKGGNRGPAVVAGKPEESLLIKAVSHLDPHLKMPQGGAKLKDEEIAALNQWVKNGAFWPETPGEFFEARIRPVLESSCAACHSGESAMGGLRLDSRANVLKGGTSGPSIVPGDPDKSLLIQAVRFTHERFKMPPGKKLPEQQIDDLVQWVKTGAVWPDKNASSAVAAKHEYLITPEQQSFWSFQKPKDSPAPHVKLRGWTKTPIDKFILAKLEEKKLAPTVAADKRTLIRRATFDLTGLPPTSEDVEAFVADASPNAFSRVVDRLLASPHYGERWGRHWLDLVRYSDSAGDSADYPVPQAYLYRNYVIDSFNQDKPYDQFLREQIAGDLLPSKTENEKWERTIATGYLAIARRFSVRPERNMYLTIDDTIDNVSKATLGLTVGCARCHDHKYDPIPTKDYYSLYGIFDSTRYPFAGSENVQEQKDLVYRLPKDKVEAVLKPHQEQLAPIDAELKKLLEEKKKFEEKDEAQTVKATADETATPQRTLKQINSEINEVRKRRVPIAAKAPFLEKTFAVAEGEGHNARVLRRGDPKNLGDEVPRRFLQILGGHKLPVVKEGSGRLQLAEWLTDPQNSLTARVMVNRIWQHHFGKGIVQTPSDFGKRGKPPTHPELLDYLAARFVESGWSIKAMHRMIMSSQVYQLASQGQAQNAQTDPSNDLLWKFNRRRLDAESLRDALLAISGELDAKKGEEHSFPHESTWNYTQHKPFTAVYETKQRSVYLMNQRIQKHPYLAIFDGADANASTAERTSSTTPIQALYMMNSSFVHEQANHFAKRLMSMMPDHRQRIDVAYRRALGRPATPEEIQKGEAYLQQSQQKLMTADTPSEQQPQQALASYLRVLLSSNEFMFVD